MLPSPLLMGVYLEILRYSDLQIVLNTMVESPPQHFIKVYGMHELKLISIMMGMTMCHQLLVLPYSLQSVLVHK